MISSNRMHDGCSIGLVNFEQVIGNTFVAAKKGTVELRAGDSVKQSAAGNQDAAGQATGCTPAG